MISFLRMAARPRVMPAYLAKARTLDLETSSKENPLTAAEVEANTLESQARDIRIQAKAAYAFVGSSDHSRRA